MTIAEQIKQAEEEMAAARKAFEEWKKETGIEGRLKAAERGARLAGAANDKAREALHAVEHRVGVELGIYGTKPGEDRIREEFRAAVADSIGLPLDAVDSLPQMNSHDGRRYKGPELFESTVFTLARATIKDHPLVVAASREAKRASEVYTKADDAHRAVLREVWMKERPVEDLVWKIRELKEKLNIAEKRKLKAEERAKETKPLAQAGISQAALSEARDRLAALNLAARSPNNVKDGMVKVGAGRYGYSPNAKQVKPPTFKWPAPQNETKAG